MLAKRKILNHPAVGEIELPLLIPAFSSKGFKFLEKRQGKKRKEYSELADALDQFSGNNWSTVLISAYDIHFKHFIKPNHPVKDVVQYLKNTRIIAVDSGGYELTKEFDSTEIKRYMYYPKEGFGKKQYESVLNKLTSNKTNLQLIISNFDYSVQGSPLDFQIKEARSLFNKYPQCISDFIIKPLTKKSDFIDPSKFSTLDFKNLKGFDIIGVTEKDLGKDLLSRLRKISELRTGLNNVSLETPIHIWGGLDPIITPLYFFAGAEIFDGVSWLRYAYLNGVAVNRECLLVLNKELGIGTSNQVNHAFAGWENLVFLNNLIISLQQWIELEGRDFGMFHGSIRKNLESAYNIMKTKIKNI